MTVLCGCWPQLSAKRQINVLLKTNIGSNTGRENISAYNELFVITQKTLL